MRILAPSIIDNSAPAPRGINGGNETKRRSYCVQCTLGANCGIPSFSVSRLGMRLCRRILKLEIDLLRVVLPFPAYLSALLSSVPRPPSVISRSARAVTDLRGLDSKCRQRASTVEPNRPTAHDGADDGTLEASRRRCLLIGSEARSTNRLSSLTPSASDLGVLG